MQEIESIGAMDNTVYNTSIEMIETKDMDMDSETERVMERIIPMPTEKIEA